MSPTRIRPPRLKAARSLVVSLGALLALAASGAAPPVAQGYVVGQYSVEACTAAVNYENHSWTFVTNDPTYIESHNTCGEAPLSGDPPSLAYLSLGDTLGAHGVPVGAAGSWNSRHHRERRSTK